MNGDFAADVREKPVDGLIFDPGRRLPFFASASAYEALDDYSAEEKALGTQLLAFQMADPEGISQPAEHIAVQKRNPTYMLQWDPQLFAREMSDYEVMVKLVIGMGNQEILEATDVNGVIPDPAIRGRHHTAMLMVTKLAYEYGDEWIQRLMSTMGGWTLSKEQYCCLGQPQSAVWSDEERLILEFTAGVVDRSMSDDLFARAQTLWGRKQLVRYVRWITYYVGFNMLTITDVTDAERAGPVELGIRA